MGLLLTLLVWATALAAAILTGWSAVGLWIERDGMEWPERLAWVSVIALIAALTAATTALALIEGRPVAEILMLQTGR